jgi:MFS family permease
MEQTNPEHPTQEGAKPVSTPQPEKYSPTNQRTGKRKIRTFSALRHPNYRLWFGGQLISLVGTWMQTTAQGYLVYQLTGSPIYLGYIGFALGAPSWLFTLYGGLIADRMPRRTLLMLTQIGMMCLAIILAILTFTRLVQPWHLIVLAFFLGIANAFDAPARQAFITELVDREDMTNAIALNSSMFNTATAVGPTIAGITYALFGPAWCFTINALSFLGVIIALGLMRLNAGTIKPTKTSALSDIKDGLRYVGGHTITMVLIAGLGIGSLFGLGFVTLMPAWAVNVLGGDVTTNGLLQSARGIGALIAALMVASLGALPYRGKLLTIGSFAFPIMLVIYSFSRWLPLSLILLVGVGWGFMMYVNLANSLVQSFVPDELRGRVMSIFILSFFGLFPVGSLVAGTAAEHLGETTTVLVSALIMLAFAIFAYLRFPDLRRLG